MGVDVAEIFPREIYSYWVTLFGLYYQGTNETAERIQANTRVCLSFHFRREKRPRLNDVRIHFKCGIWKLD